MVAAILYVYPWDYTWICCPQTINNYLTKHQEKQKNWLKFVTKGTYIRKYELQKARKQGIIF